MIKHILRKFSNDMAIDLGTANTLVYTTEKGIVLEEPSVVAINTRAEKSKSIMAVGNDAKIMVGRTPNSIKMVKPLKNGVIADFDTTEAMLKYFVKKASSSFFSAPRLVICIPYGATQVERKAIYEAGMSSGARETYLIDEPMAAAIGAGLPVSEASGSMVIDIGGGTSEIAVISYGGIVISKSVRVGGNRMDSDIANYIRRERNVLIGANTAEKIKIEIGCAGSYEESKTMVVNGRDLVKGIPDSIIITQKEIAKSLKNSVEEIVRGVKTCLEKTPPEMAADIIDKGIILSGGGGKLSGLAELLRERTGLPIILDEHPLHSVALGCGEVLKELDAMKGTMIMDSGMQ